MRTKIIATIGPASDSRETISRLISEGVHIFRLNFSHGAAKDFIGLIKLIRELEALQEFPITILQDLAGPKIRIGEIEGDSVTVSKDQILYLGLDSLALPKTAKPQPAFLPFDHQTILESLEVGDKLALADGALNLVVEQKIADNLFEIKALNSGIITSRKGLALPGKPLNLPALTDKDRQNLLDGLELGVDAVALSYVQTPEDILQAREIIRSAGCNIPIIAKLERQNAVERLEEILEVTDIVMVARGDLGVECPLENLPNIQKRIIRACNRAAKPVIVATQMLLSMVSSPSPTRAEVTDVANAVLDGADCVMLSEETAMGAYPVETVQYMQKITTAAETFLLEDSFLPEPQKSKGTPEFLAYSACLLADKSNATALVAHSTSGATARLLSASQPSQPVYALTTNPEVLHTLNFSWGVKPWLVPKEFSTHLNRVEKFIDTYKLFTTGQVFVITAGQPKEGHFSINTNLVKIYIK